MENISKETLDAFVRDIQRTAIKESRKSPSMLVQGLIISLDTLNLYLNTNYETNVEKLTEYYSALDKPALKEK